MGHDDTPEKRIAELERMQGRASARWPGGQPPAYPPAPGSGWHRAPNPYPAQPQPGWLQTPSWPQQPQVGQPPVGESEYLGPPLAYSEGLPAKYRAIPSGRPRGSKYGIVFVVIAVILLPSIYVALGSNLALSRRHAYNVGTPATAEVYHCYAIGTSRKNCNGSWTVDGAVQWGPVVGTDIDTDESGTKMDVRVHNGNAYTDGVVASAQRWTIGIAVYAAVMAAGALVGLFWCIHWYIRKRRRLKHPPAPPPNFSAPGMYPPTYQTRRTNQMAISALVVVLFATPAAIVFGHIALSQIKRTGEKGRGLAVAGLAIGYAATGYLLFVLVTELLA